jgi:hypothetical protein
MPSETEIRFQTDFFKIIPGEDEETNPGCYGKSLALWLVEKLKARHFAIESMEPEDFGWCVTIVCADDPACRIWLLCGNTDGKEGRSWMVWSAVAPRAPLWKNLLAFHRRPEYKEMEKLDWHLKELLPAIPGIVFSEDGGTSP